MSRSRLSKAEAARRVARVLAGKPAIGCDGTECKPHSHKDWCWNRKCYERGIAYCCLHTGHKGPHAACGMTHNLLIWSRNGRIIKMHHEKETPYQALSYRDQVS